MLRSSFLLILWRLAHTAIQPDSYASIESGCIAVCLNCFIYIIGDHIHLGKPEIWYTFVLFFIS